MNVLILATKNCNHRPLLEEQLKKMDISYEIRYVDEHPELVKKFGAHTSPIIIADDEVVFRGKSEQPLPNKLELKKLLALQLFDQGVKSLSQKSN